MLAEAGNKETMVLKSAHPIKIVHLDMPSYFYAYEIIKNARLSNHIDDHLTGRLTLFNYFFFFFLLTTCVFLPVLLASFFSASILLIKTATSSFAFLL